jgi:hypothetical protein
VESCLSSARLAPGDSCCGLSQRAIKAEYVCIATLACVDVVPSLVGPRVLWPGQTGPQSLSVCASRFVLLQQACYTPAHTMQLLMATTCHSCTPPPPQQTLPHRQPTDTASAAPTNTGSTRLLFESRTHSLDQATTPGHVPTHGWGERRPEPTPCMCCMASAAAAAAAAATPTAAKQTSHLQASSQAMRHSSRAPLQQQL